MAIDPRNPIVEFGGNFEMAVSDDWQLAFDVNTFRKGVFFQNNSANDVTLSKTGRGVAGQGIVLAAGGGFYSEDGEPDVLGRIQGVHQGKWWVIAAVAGPSLLELGES